MKGYVYYASEDAERNAAFIEDLIHEAERVGIDLQLLVDEETPPVRGDFILFRGRQFTTAMKFELDGWHVFNSSEVNRIANNKILTYELAQNLGIPAIKTKECLSLDEIASFPTVIKTVDGHGGNEVFLCHTAEEASKVFSQFQNRKLITQPYIESNSTDVRVFMLGHEIIGAVKRIGQDSFKSNYTLGGTIEKYIPPTAMANAAIKIAKTLKSDYIGIDFLLLPNGHFVLNEIEDPVGARSLYFTHEFSVAERLLGYVKTIMFKREINSYLIN